MYKTREELLLELLRNKYQTQTPTPASEEEPQEDAGIFSGIKNYIGNKIDERNAWKDNLGEQDLSWLAQSEGKNMQIGQQLAQTFYNTLENVVDTGADILAKGANAVGWDGVSKNLTDFSNRNLTEEITGSDIFKLAQQTGLIKLGSSANSDPMGIIPGMVKNYTGSLMAGDQDKVFEMAHNKEMLPPIATDVVDSLSSMVVMGTLGQGNIPAIMGLSGAGAFQESYDNGGTFGESLAYGTTSGIVEGLAEKFIGKGLEKIGLGNNKVGGIFGGSTSGSVVKDFIKSFNEEGMEELASQLISPSLKKLTFKNDKDWATIFEEDGGVEALFEAYILGGISGGIGGATSSISNIQKYGVEGKNAFNSLEKAKETFGKLVKLDKSGNLTNERIAKHEKKLQEHLNEYLKNMEVLKSKYGKESKQYKNTLSETGRTAVDLDTMTANDVNIANEINESKAKIKSYQSYIPQEYQAEIKKILGDKATESDLNSNAYITSDGRILVNRGSNAYKQGRLYNVVGHEIIHTIENTPEYAKMLKDYNDNLTQEEKQATINKYRASYGQQMTDDQIMNEMFADYVGKNVAINYKEFKRMLGNKQSFWSKLLDVVKGYKGIVHEGARKLQSDVANAINKSTGNMQMAKASKEIKGKTKNEQRENDNGRTNSTRQSNVGESSGRIKQTSSRRTSESNLQQNTDNITRKDNDSISKGKEENSERNRKESRRTNEIKFSKDVNTYGIDLPQQVANYFSDSYAREGEKLDGRLKVVFHTTRTGGFSVFDPNNMSDENIGSSGAYRFPGHVVNFFTDSLEMSQSYAYSPDFYDPKKDTQENNLTYEGYIDIKKPLIVEGGENAWKLLELPKEIQSELDKAVNLFKSDNRIIKDLEKANWFNLSECLNSVDNELQKQGIGIQIKHKKIKDYYGDTICNVGFYTKENQFIKRFSLKEMVFFENSKKNYKTFVYDQMRYIRWSTNDYVNYAITNGNYDGVIIKNVYDYGANTPSKLSPCNVYVTIKSSNQFKHIDNTAPTKDADIRFSKDVEMADDVFDIFAEETGMNYSEDNEEFQNWLSEHPDYEELINEAYGEDDEYSDFDDDYDFDDENTSDEDNYDDSEYKKNVKWSNSFNSDGEEISIQQEKFFEESKFRNEEEDLLVLYHGSNKAGFMTFNSKTGVFFFTPYIDVASSYTRSGRLVVTKKFKTADELIDWWYDKGASEMGKIHAGIDILPKEYAEREIKEYLDFLEEYYPEDEKFINFKRKSFDNAEYIVLDGAIPKAYSEEDLLNNFLKDMQEKTNLEYEEYKEKYEIEDNEIDEEDKRMMGKSNNVYKVYVNCKKPAIIECRGNNFLNVPFRGKRMRTDDIAKIIKEEGRFDGVIFKNIVDNGPNDFFNEGGTTDVYVAFEPNQIKATDNYNPTSKSDIRFSKDVLWEDEEQQRISEKVEYNLDDYDSVHKLVELSEETLTKMKAITDGDETEKSLTKLYNEALKSHKREDYEKFKQQVEAFEYYHKTAIDAAKKGKTLDPKFISRRLSEDFRKRLVEKPDGVQSQFKRVLTFNKERLAELEKIVVEQDENAIKMERAKQVLTQQKNAIDRDFESIPTAELKRNPDDKESYGMYMANRINGVSSEEEFNVILKELGEYKKVLQAESDRLSGAAVFKNKVAELQKTLDELKKYEDNRVVRGKTDKTRAEYKAKIDKALERAQEAIDNIVDEETLNEAVEMLRPSYDPESRKNNVYKAIEKNSMDASEMSEEEIARIKNPESIVKFEDEYKEIFDRKTDLDKKIEDDKSDKRRNLVSRQRVVKELKQAKAEMQMLYDEKLADKGEQDLANHARYVTELEEIDEDIKKYEAEIVELEKEKAEAQEKAKKEPKTKEKVVDVEDEKGLRKQIRELKAQVEQNKKMIEQNRNQKTKVIKNSVKTVAVDKAKNIKAEADATQLVKYDKKVAIGTIELVKSGLKCKQKGTKFRTIYSQKGIKQIEHQVFELMNSGDENKVAKICETIKSGLEVYASDYSMNAKGEVTLTKKKYWRPFGKSIFAKTDLETKLNNQIREIVESALSDFAKPTALADLMQKHSAEIQNRLEDLEFELGKYIEENQTLINKIENLEKKIADTSIESEAFKQLKKEIDDTNKAVKALDKKFTKTQNKNEKLITQNNKLKVLNKTLLDEARKAKAKERRALKAKLKAESELNKHRYTTNTSNEINAMVREVFHIEKWDIYSDEKFANEFAEAYMKGKPETAEILVEHVLNEKVLVEDENGDKVETTVRELYSEEEINEMKKDMQSDIENLQAGTPLTKMMKWKQKHDAKVAKMKNDIKIDKAIDKMNTELKKLANNAKKRGGGTHPTIVEGLIEFKDITKLSKKEIREGKVKEAISEFYKTYKDLMDKGELPDGMDEDLLNHIEAAINSEGELTLEEIKWYTNTAKGLYKYFEKLHGYWSFNVDGENHNVKEVCRKGIVAQKKIYNSLKKKKDGTKTERWIFQKAIEEKVVFDALDSFEEDGTWKLLYKKFAEGEFRREELELKYFKENIDVYREKHKNFLKKINKNNTIDGITLTNGQFLGMYTALQDSDWKASTVNAYAKSLLNGRVINLKADKEVEDFRKKIAEHYELDNAESAGAEMVKLYTKLAEMQKNDIMPVQEDTMGYHNMKEGFYYPKSVLDENASHEIGKKEQRNKSLEGMIPSFVKERTGNNRPVAITSLWDVIVGRSHQVASYCGFAEAKKLLNYYYNAKMKADPELGIDSGESVGSIAKKRFGLNNGVYILDEHLDRLVKDLDGESGVYTTTEKVLNYVRSSSVTFQLALSVPTALKQFGGLVTATRRIKPAYITKGFLRASESMPPLPIAGEYRVYESMYIAAEARASLEGHKKKALLLNNKADKKVVYSIWGGALEQTKNADGTDNIEAATKLFNEALTNTQTNSSPLFKSRLLRWKGTVGSFITMYQAENNKLFSSIVEPILKIHYKRRTGRQINGSDYKLLAKSASIATLSTAFSVAITMLFRWLREKEDEETIVAKSFEQLANDMFSIIPYMNLVNVRWVDGFKVDAETSIGYLEDLWNGITDTFSALMKGEVVNSIDQFATTIGRVFGLPYGNVKTQILSQAKHFTRSIARNDEWNKGIYQFEALLEGISNDNKAQINAALKKGRGAKAEAYYDEYTDNIMTLTKSTKKELFELYKNGYSESSGKSSSTAYLKTIPNSIIVDNESIEVDKKHFKEVYSQVAPQLQKLIDSKAYKNTNEDSKNKAVSLLVNSYYNTAKKTLYTKEELSNLEYLLSTNYYNVSTDIIHLANISQMDKTFNKTKKAVVQGYINRLNIPKGQKYLIYYLAGYSVSDENKKHIEMYLKVNGLRPSQIKKLLKTEESQLDKGEKW
jgi:hypothetical protein